MSKTKWFIAAVIVIVLVAGGAFLQRQLIESAHVSSGITDLSENYKAHKEIEEAKEALAHGVVPAKVITTAKSGHHIALVFDGLPNRATTGRIIDLLKKYDAQAVFFVEGQNAANQPETIKLIRDAGMGIGNYTFIGIAHADALPEEKLVEQLCQTQKVIKVLTDKSPVLVRAPKTAYTPQFLSTAAACGIDFAVQSTVSLPVHSVKTIADSDAFATSLKDGDIIAVPIGRPVEVSVMKPGKTDDRPAFDKKPTIKDVPQQESQKNDIADVIERLLISLQRLNYQFDLLR